MIAATYGASCCHVLGNTPPKLGEALPNLCHSCLIKAEKEVRCPRLHLQETSIGSTAMESGIVRWGKMERIWEIAASRGHHGVVFDPQRENVRALETCGPVDVTLRVW